METDKTPRVNVGIRVSPRLKNELSMEASALGQSVSEYGENILHNRQSTNEEIVKLKMEIFEKDAVIEELNSTIKDLKERVPQDLERMTKVGDAIETKGTAPLPGRTIYNDERLHYLLSQLKGRHDLVKNAFGDSFKIQYNTMDDVLIALVYSSKIN